MKKILLLIVTIIAVVAVWAFGPWSKSANQSASQPARVEHLGESPVRQAQANTPSAAQPTVVHRAKASIPAYNLKDASPFVQGIVNLKNDIRERDLAARALGTSQLTMTEMNALSQFLSEKHDEDATEGGRALKNIVMDLLCGQSQKVSSYVVPVLEKIFRDASQDIVIRDYAVQHLGQFYDRLEEKPAWPAEQVEPGKAAIQQVLWDALAETDSSIAGTSIIALSRLSLTRPDFDRARIGATALQWAADAKIGGITRISALQVCATLQLQQSLPLLAQEAQHETDVSLRISAIGALGDLGGQSEADMLYRMTMEDNPRVLPAALLALKKVKDRLTTQ